VLETHYILADKMSSHPTRQWRWSYYIPYNWNIYHPVFILFLVMWSWKTHTSIVILKRHLWNTVKAHLKRKQSLLSC